MLDHYPGIRVPGTFDAFELAIRAILGQQVSVAGATTLTARLVQRFGDACVSPFAEITHHFPLAERLAGLTVEELATIGLPKTRAATIRGFAQFSAAGHLQMPPGTSLESAVAHMKMVAGIGDWTAHYICLRALRFPDAFPAGDMGLQKAAAVVISSVSTTHSTRLTEKQLAAMAQSWSPWRGYAALLLWYSL
ncbi:MAG: hypothetical protein NWQ13_02330 [Glaciimonas sp.]|nr:hypothetical protein [Glaciimonas sp.]